MEMSRIRVESIYGRERSGRPWKFKNICGEKELQCLSNAIQARRIYPFVCMTAIKLTQQKCGDLELNPCVCVLSWQGGP